MSVESTPLPSEVSEPRWLYAFQADESFDAPGDEMGIPTAGKWMLFCNTETIDDIWKRVADAVKEGDLGPVACASSAGMARDNKQVIFVYVTDWRDTEEVKRVLSGIRALGVEDRLSFKRDADSVMRNIPNANNATYISASSSEFYTKRAGGRRELTGSRYEDHEVVQMLEEQLHDAIVAAGFRLDL